MSLKDKAINAVDNPYKTQRIKI